MKNGLILPSEEFIDYVEHSAQFLNCPKAILNDNLDSMFRQFYTDENAAYDAILSYLKKYKIQSPAKQALDFVVWRKSISMNDFRTINVNSYIDNLPERMERKNDEVNAYIEKGTTYYHGAYGSGGVSTVPSYPDRKSVV